MVQISGDIDCGAIFVTFLVGQWDTDCDEGSEGRLKWTDITEGIGHVNRSRNIRYYIDKDIVLTTHAIMALESRNGISLCSVSVDFCISINQIRCDFVHRIRVTSRQI